MRASLCSWFLLSIVVQFACPGMRAERATFCLAKNARHSHGAPRSLDAKGGRLGMTMANCTTTLLSLKMQPKLLRNSETDVTPDRHEQWAPGMGCAPVHPEPNVHAWAHPEVD